MAQQTVVGIFDSASEAQQAVDELVSEGFSRSNIDISTNSADGNYTSGSSGSIPDRHTNTSGTMAEEVVDDTKDVVDRAGDTIPDRHRNTSGTMAEEVVDDTKDVGDSIGDFFKSLFGGGDDDDDNYKKHAEVGRRSTIVTVHAQSEDEAERAADILDDNGAVDVDERATQYGYGKTTTGTDTISGSGTAYVDASSRDRDVTNRDQDLTNRDVTTDNDQTIKVIQENLEIGKREVQTGGVRVRSRIVEKPVEENLRLREERVTVQRTPVNRPATDADLNAFQEGQIELTEHAEVPVVSKTANVVEEISIGKEVNERNETVRDTVRNTEVDVENLGKTDVTDPDFTGTGRTDQSVTTNRTDYNDDDLNTTSTNR